MDRRNRRNLLFVLLFVVILPLLTSCALFITNDGRLQIYRVYYAKEVVADVYTIPGITSLLPFPEVHVTYQQAVYRAINRNFFLRVTLSNGAKFSSTGAEPTLAYDANAAGSATVNPLVGAAAGQNYVEWLVSVTGNFTETGDGPPRWNVGMTDVAINAGQILQNGGAIDVTVSTRDASTGVPFDSALSGKFLVGVPGFWYGKDEAFMKTNAIVDLDQEEKLFVVPNGPDSPTVDRGADAGAIGPGVYMEEEEGEFTPGAVFVFAPDGNPYSLSSGDQLDLVFGSNLSSISRIFIGNDEREYRLTDQDRASASLTLTIPGDVVNEWTFAPAPVGFPYPSLPVGTDLPVSIEVKGDEPIRTRILTVAIRLRLANGQQRELLAPTEITRWVIDGSILVAPWVNGNDPALTTLVALMNHSGRSGNVKVRVLSLPRVGTPSQDLGSVAVGVLPANGTASINVAEQVLEPLGLRPYLLNGGNLSLEVVIERANVSGVSTVYGPSTAFGTTEMYKSPLSLFFNDSEDDDGGSDN